MVTTEQKQALSGSETTATQPNKATERAEIVSATPEQASEAPTSHALLITHAEALQQGSHAVVVGVFKGPKRAERFIQEVSATQLRRKAFLCRLYKSPLAVSSSLAFVPPRSAQASYAARSLRYPLASQEPGSTPFSSAISTLL